MRLQVNVVVSLCEIAVCLSAVEVSLKFGR